MIVLDSALKRYSEKDIRRVLTFPVGIRDHSPRHGVRAVGGFTAQGVPVVVLMDMRRDFVFHAQRPEKVSPPLPRTGLKGLRSQSCRLALAQLAGIRSVFHCVRRHSHPAEGSLYTTAPPFDPN